MDVGQNFHQLIPPRHVLAQTMPETAHAGRELHAPVPRSDHEIQYQGDYFEQLKKYGAATYRAKLINPEVKHIANDVITTYGRHFYKLEF